MVRKTVAQEAGRVRKKPVSSKLKPGQVAQALKEIRFDCATVLNNAGDGVLIVNHQGYIIFQNAVSQQRTGVSLDGLRFSEVVRDFGVDQAKLYFDRALCGENVPPIQYTYAKPDGEELTVEVTSRPMFIDGKAMAVVLIARDVTEHKKIETALLESERRYRKLVESSLQGIVIAQGLPPRIVFANRALTDILGYSVDELTSLEPGQGMTILDAEHHDMLYGRYLDRMKGKSVPSRYEVLAVRKDGRKRWIEVSSHRIEYNGGPAVQAVFVDITEQKLAQEALQRTHDALEDRVKERTAELKEVNRALRVLLKQRDRDKSRLEDKVVLNVKELVVPYAERLQTVLTDDKDIAYLKVLESNLRDIISPFAQKLSSRYSSLTPMEIRTAQFIRDGKTTKEIADLLNLSTRTIESHRKNIRTKMGLHGKKANLRSHLLSL